MKQFINFFKPILFGIGVVVVLQIIVFPGLSTNDTIINILSLLIGIALIYAVVKYIESFSKNDQPVVIEKPKRKPKAKGKSRPLVTLDFTDAKGMNEIVNVITQIVEGRVKISVENPKPKTTN